MRKLIKTKLVGLIGSIIGLVLSIVGYGIFGHLLESAKGAVIKPNTSTNISIYASSGWGSGKTQEVAQKLQLFCIVAIIFFIIMVITLAVQYIKIKNAKTNIQHGEIIEVKLLTATVQFENGERTRCTIDSDAPVVQGDRGIIHTKCGFITKFEPDNKQNI